jgi:Stf0 sulphotransferase
LPESVASPASRFIFLISHERSGSHYLADMLIGNCGVRSFDEVCNYNAIDPDTAPASFFRFRRDAQVKDPDIALRPSVETNKRLMDAYLAHLAALVPGDKKLFIDIKYGHIHNFEVGWWPTERRPFLSMYLEEKGIKAVHLTRRDALAAIVSGQIADKRRVWHKKDDSTATFPKVRIPAMKAVQEAIALEREKENLLSWLAPHLSFDVEYEELTISDVERDAVMTRLCNFLGLDAPARFPSEHRKVTPPLHEAVENYDDLMRVARLFGNGRWRFHGH